MGWIDNSQLNNWLKPELKPKKPSWMRDGSFDSCNGDLGMCQAEQPRAVYTSKTARSQVNKIKRNIDNYYKNKYNIPNILPYQKGNNKNDEEDNPSDRMNSLLKRIKAIQAGNFEYSDEEKKALDNLKRIGEIALKRQERANMNYEGGTRLNEFRSGRARYAQEMADDAIANAINYGVEKLNEIDLKTQESISKMKNAIKENRIKELLNEYNNVRKLNKDKNDYLMKMQKALMDYYKTQAYLDKMFKTNDILNYEYKQQNPQFYNYLLNTKYRNKTTYNTNKNNEGGSLLFF